MKKKYSKFTKAIQNVHQMFEDKKPITSDLNQCLSDKNYDNFYAILNVVFYLMGHLIKNISKFEEELLSKGHVAKRISRDESKSLFPLQIIKTIEGEYYIVFSFKNKITDWQGRGSIRTAKEALILKIVGNNTQWIKGVDSVAKADKIDLVMHELKLMNLIQSRNIHKIIEGAQYIGKNGEIKKSVISKFAEGGTIGAIVDEGYLRPINLNLIDIFIICYGSVVAMCELHKMRITHNDAHEGNFFLFLENNPLPSEDGKLYRPKIADFDASRKHENILSDEFKTAVDNDVKRLVINLIKFLKISFTLDKHDKKIVEKLLLKIISIGNCRIPFKYDTEALLKELNDFLIEIRLSASKSAVVISQYVTTQYPEFSAALLTSTDRDSKELKKHRQVKKQPTETISSDLWNKNDKCPIIQSGVQLIL